MATGRPTSADGRRPRLHQPARDERSQRPVDNVVFDNGNDPIDFAHHGRPTGAMRVQEPRRLEPAEVRSPALRHLHHGTRAGHGPRPSSTVRLGTDESDKSLTIVCDNGIDATVTATDFTRDLLPETHCSFATRTTNPLRPRAATRPTMTWTAARLRVDGRGRCSSERNDPDRLGSRCDDGVDNDGDGLRTSGPPWPAAAIRVLRVRRSDRDVVEACTNGADNDGDGKMDRSGGDPGCSTPSDSTEKRDGGLRQRRRQRRRRPTDFRARRRPGCSGRPTRARRMRRRLRQRRGQRRRRPDRLRRLAATRLREPERPDRDGGRMPATTAPTTTATA